MKFINSVCQDQDDQNYFAIVTKLNPNEYHFCHVFKSLSSTLTSEIILTIGQAFDEAFKIFVEQENSTLGNNCE
jgi:hypothetical protein